MPARIETAIAAREFTVDTDEHSADHWSAGKLRHLIAALDGAPIVVTVDRTSGFSLVGGFLLGVSASATGATLVQASDGDHPYWVEARLLGETIIPLTGNGEKWEALSAFRSEQARAIDYVRKNYEIDVGPGRWTATPGLVGVDVALHPRDGTPAVHWHVAP